MIATVGISCPPRFGTRRSPERATLGPAVGLVAAVLGKPLMEWQQYVADILLEIDPVTGELVYDEWILTVPRQSGKSTLVLAKATHRCTASGFFGAGQTIAYVAQTKMKSVEKFERDYGAALLASQRFGRGPHRVKVRTGNNKIDVRFANGSVFGVEATTERAGHGPTLDEAYVDEAFSQVDNRTEDAFGPAMVTRVNKQLGIVSTAGWLDASPYLLEKVRLGRELVADDVRRGTACFEWSAPDDADPGDENVWLACMPALHRPECPPRCTEHTLRMATIRSEYEKAVRSGKLSNFCRAYLNQWKKKPREGEETALGNWAACSRAVLASSLPALAGLAVSVTADRSATALGACGFIDDDRPLVMPIADIADPDDAARAAARISMAHSIPVVVYVGGSSGEAMVTAIEDAGGTVERVRFPEYAAACAGIYDHVRRGTLAHPDDPALNEAVLGARWRKASDKRVFGRKESESEIASLEAVTLALYGAERHASYDLLASIY